MIEVVYAILLIAFISVLVLVRRADPERFKTLSNRDAKQSPLLSEVRLPPALRGPFQVLRILVYLMLFAGLLAALFILTHLPGFT